MTSLRPVILLVSLAFLPLFLSEGAALDHNRLPQPIFDAKPGFVELYWKAWDFANDHILRQQGIAQSPYMDEAFDENVIWIWDTSFMVLFCRYAPDQFPGIQSLNNFYLPIHDGTKTSLHIRHPDNPPLFAWVEWEYYQHTGDTKRLKFALPYLEKHYEWFQKAQRGQKFPWAEVEVFLKPEKLGFRWGGISSGMDNSPRFAGDIFAIDALAQQGLAAKSISSIAREIGENTVAQKYDVEYERIKKLINTRYWDDKDGFYYDLAPDGRSFSRVCTPASFWPVLAGMASPPQIFRMVSKIQNKDELGGTVPWVSVSRSDPGFDSRTGNYWRGAMWLPLAYVGIRALTENGQEKVASTTAEAVLDQMLATYKNYEPHTIWECYAPNSPEPAAHDGTRVRRDFCGWSALGPIALFIENVIGIHTLDARRQSIQWSLDRSRPGRQGVTNLKLGANVVDLVYDGKSKINVAASQPFALEVNGKIYRITERSQVVEL